ncbi:arginase family protein [Asanoa siamensis]|uniref:Arginase n=1 Tax=Asanoa siamensis TaxID=926357 RepID=A0ABQ4CJX1_9ACTN|nr:arginase family protein [Asanoa siamensis]GIF71584.1 arginase [Asanoa siamensis]
MSGWFLLGAPWDSSGSRRGEERAPGALRAAGLAGRVAVDLGDAATVIGGETRDPATGVRALPDTLAATRALAEALAHGMRAHPELRPLVVGGDCSLLLGVFAHLRRAHGDVGLWLVDGHPDYVDAQASDTGETADMEFAALTGAGPAVLAGRQVVVADDEVLPGRQGRSDEIAETAPMVASRHAALIGHRTTDLDAGAVAELARVPRDVLTIDARAVVDDPGAAGRRAAAWAAGLGVPMWLHVDVDVLDPSALPAVTYPQAGGPDLDDLADLLAPLAAAPGLIGVSVADFRPDLDPDGRHANRLVALLDQALWT